MQNKNLPPAAGALPANGMSGANHGVPLDIGTLRLVFARLVCIVCSETERPNLCVVFLGAIAVV